MLAVGSPVGRESLVALADGRPAAGWRAISRGPRERSTGLTVEGAHVALWGTLLAIRRSEGIPKRITCPSSLAALILLAALWPISYQTTRQYLLPHSMSLSTLYVL